MKRRFWGGTSEIHQSSLNNRVDTFLDVLRSCLEILNPSFAKLSRADEFSVDILQSADDLKYFFSWLKDEGLKNTKYIANFDAQVPSDSLGYVLDDCTFILEDTKEQEDHEIACANLADAIMYLSKAIKATTQSKIVPEKKMTPIRKGNNFELIESDFDFEDELPIAA